MRKQKKSHSGLLFIILIIGVVVVVYFARNYLYISKPIIKTADGKDVSLYIPTGSDYKYVKNELSSLNVLISKNAFDWLAKRSH